MNTYYFLEREARGRITEYRRWAAQDRLAILARQAPRREAQTLKPRWFTVLLQIPALNHLLGRRSMAAGPGAGSQ